MELLCDVPPWKTRTLPRDRVGRQRLPLPVRRGPMVTVDRVWASAGKYSSRLLWSGFTLFVVSRLLISTSYDVYISDLFVYHYSATQSLVAGSRAYLDYFFPYPPLALALTTWPIYVATDFNGYRELFHLAFLLLEIGLVLVALRVGRKTLGLDSSSLFLFLLAYSALGFLQGHLLYDRIDLVIALAMVVSAATFPIGRGRTGMAWTWLAWNGGFLVKIMPALWAPFTALLWEAREAPASPVRQVVRAALRTTTAFLPSLALLIAFSVWSRGALWSSLGDHGARTIQIESTWASLLFLCREVLPGYSPEVITRWGAQHIAPESIPVLVDFLSRYLGWIVWLAALSWIAFRGIDRLRRFSYAELSLFHFYLITATLLGFMATQRVLSPQFFLWVMAPLALIVVHRRSWLWAAGVTAVYALTWMGFDRHYADLARLDRFAVNIVAARNILLIALWLGVCGELRRQWRN